MHAYPASVSVRKLFAILVALAVLFAPAFSRAGEAFAAAPDHHAQMMEGGHCQSPPAESDGHDKAAEKSCCISMCMGVAVTPPAPARAEGPAPAPAVSAIPPLHLSYLGEIATPPPKFA
jgi:hypothetical protein